MFNFKKKRKEDPDWRPSQEESFDDEILDDILEKATKRTIVNKASLLSLFEVCRVLNCRARILPDNIKSVTHGLYIRITSYCDQCKKSYEWESNKKVRGNVSEADLSFISEAKLNGIPTKQLLDLAQGINL